MNPRQGEDQRRVVRHTPKDSMSAGTAQTDGMRRVAGISGALVGSDSVWMGEAHMAPASRSANHHHGASETAIYVLAGHPVFVFMENGAEARVEAGPGDYVYVPPFVAHREENPALDEEAVVILARTTQEAIVVSVSEL